MECVSSNGLFQMAPRPAHRPWGHFRRPPNIATHILAAAVLFPQTAAAIPGLVPTAAANGTAPTHTQLDGWGILRRHRAAEPNAARHPEPLQAEWSTWPPWSRWIDWSTWTGTGAWDMEWRGNGRQFRYRRRHPTFPSHPSCPVHGRCHGDQN